MMNSREIAKSGAICDQTPFPAAKPSVIYGRVMAPANGMGEGQVSFGEGGIRLGGAFAQIKLKAEEEDRERRRVEDRAKAGETARNPAQCLMFKATLPPLVFSNERRSHNPGRAPEHEQRGPRQPEQSPVGEIECGPNV